MLLKLCKHISNYLFIMAMEKPDTNSQDTALHDKIVTYLQCTDVSHLESKFGSRSDIERESAVFQAYPHSKGLSEAMKEDEEREIFLKAMKKDKTRNFNLPRVGLSYMARHLRRESRKTIIDWRMGSIKDRQESVETKAQRTVESWSWRRQLLMRQQCY